MSFYMYEQIFWILIALMTTFYSSISIFTSFSSTFVEDLWLPPMKNSEQIINIDEGMFNLPYLCCIFLSPFVGLFIDKNGQRIKLLMIGCVNVIIGLFGIYHLSPIHSMMFLGIGYSFFESTIWIAITFVVR